MNILIIGLRGLSSRWGGGRAREVMAQLARRWGERVDEVKILCAFEGRGLPQIGSVNGFEVVRAGNFYSALPTLMRLYGEKYRAWAHVVLESLLSYPLYMPPYVRCPTFVLVYHVMERSLFQVSPLVKAVFGYVRERPVPHLLSEG